MTESLDIIPGTFFLVTDETGDYNVYELGVVKKG